MIKTAQILGLIGGIGGAILTSLIILIVRLRRILERVGERSLEGLSIWSYLVFVFAIAGIIGAALVRSNPRVGGIMMIVSGAGGIAAVIFRIVMTNRLSIADLIEGIFSLLLLLSGILGMMAFRRLKAIVSEKQQT